MIIPSEVVALPATLWGPAPWQRRSAELSPIYVERYAGPREVRRYDRHAFWEFEYCFGGEGAIVTDREYVLAAHSACRTARSPAGRGSTRSGSGCGGSA